MYLVGYMVVAVIRTVSLSNLALNMNDLNHRKLISSVTHSETVNQRLEVILQDGVEDFPRAVPSGVGQGDIARHLRRLAVS